MAKSFFPKGLLFKEWMQKRWIVLIACLCISPSVFFETLMPLTDSAHRWITITSSDGSVQHVDTVATTFDWFCNEIVGHFSAGWWATAVVIGLAIFSVWSERNHEVGWFTFSGPITKRQVLRAKYTFDIGLIVALFTVLAIAMLIIDAAIGIHYPLFGIFRWWIAELAVQCAMYGLTLLIATLIGNAVAVAVLTLGAVTVPGHLLNPYVAGFMVNWTAVQNASQHAALARAHMSWVISHFSPIHWFNVDFSQPYVHPWPYFVGFLIFATVACLVSERIYDAAKTERLSNFFAFQWLFHPLVVVLAGLAACIIVKDALAGADAFIEAAWVVIITAVLWGSVWSIRRMAVRWI